MDLGEVLKTYLSDDHQGQLVIKFIEEEHLCKISVENGQAIYMTLGSMGPEAALDAIVGKVADWSNFIKGLPARKRLDEPLNQHLFEIAGASPPAANDDSLAASSATETAAVTAGGDSADARQIKAAVSRFIDIVGPLGTILYENICRDLAYTEGAEMNAATYSRFIAAMAAEVPEQDRQGFIDTAS